MIAERKSQEQVLEVIKLLCKEKDIAVSHLNVTIVEKDKTCAAVQRDGRKAQVDLH